MERDKKWGTIRAGSRGNLGSKNMRASKDEMMVRNFYVLIEMNFGHETLWPFYFFHVVISERGSVPPQVPLRGSEPGSTSVNGQPEYLLKTS